MPLQTFVRPVRVASLPSRSKAIRQARVSTTAAPATPTTATQPPTTARSGPPLNTAMKLRAASASSSTTSEVLEVDISTRNTDRAAPPLQTMARLGVTTAAAICVTAARAMTLPSEFFSTHTPRQAPGNNSVIRPQSGFSTASISDSTPIIAKAVASTSRKRGQLQRAARAIPAREVQTSARVRRRVLSGAMDQTLEAITSRIRASSQGERFRIRNVSPGRSSTSAIASM